MTIRRPDRREISRSVSRQSNRIALSDQLDVDIRYLLARFLPGKGDARPFGREGGKLFISSVYDMMIAELNPTTTKLQFQVSTLQEGYDPVTYFHKYPGRFLSMHCQDWVK